MKRENAKSVVTAVVASSACATEYPIVLVHGLGFRDRKLLNYWGRIPKALQAEGATVLYSHQDAWGTIEHNAATVKRAVLAAMEETGAEKVNLLAHSKGGLDARYMISALDMADKVASLTMISTPHMGSKTMDWILRAPKWLCRFAGFFVNTTFKVLGDEKPDFYRASCQLKTASAVSFNEAHKDCEGVYYQSYAVSLRRARSDFMFALPYRVVKHFDGANDGIVSVESAKWGVFRGELAETGRRGLSHADIVDIRRRDLQGVDIRGLYVGIVRELKDRGL